MQSAAFTCIAMLVLSSCAGLTRVDGISVVGPAASKVSTADVRSALAQDASCAPGKRHVLTRVEVVSPSEMRIHHRPYRRGELDYTIFRRVGSRWRCDGYMLTLSLGAH